MNLYLKTALFTVVMPGTFAVLIPFLIAGDRPAGGGVARALAFCLFALGTVVYLRCAWDFAAIGKGTPAPFDAPKRLVTRGFYRYTRNPMYVAVLSVVAGWGILSGSTMLLAYWIAIFVVFSLFIRFYEEPHLTREFGDDYPAYMKRVGRWLPRPTCGRTR